MKCEILKRTAIALFVGGVISTYASAADGQLDTAFETIKTAIETNKAGLESKADKALVDELDEDVGKLEDKVNGIAETAANKDDLGKLNDAVVKLQEDTNEHTGILSQNSEDIAANKEAIEANRTDIDANKAEIEKIKNLQGYDSLTKVENIVSNKADQDYVEGLEKDVKINTSDIKELSEGIRDNILPALEANRTDIDANKAEIAKKADKTEVDTLKNQAVGAAAAANLLAQNIGLNKTNIEKNASAIVNIRNKQALQNARLDNHGQRIDANKSAIATNKADIATNADKIATNKADIANKADKNSVYSKFETDNKFALKADNSVVSAQAADINNLRTDVNAHKVDINKLRTDVNTHTKRLDHLDNRVNKLDKDLKRGLAAQAALTGLFQPYTVGKANFTAAVGGYKSQTAVAIGTGYRYNQNIATKAGVAFTQGGGVTYNAGVNFEW